MSIIIFFILFFLQIRKIQEILHLLAYQWRNNSSAFGANAPPKFFDEKIQHSHLLYFHFKIPS